jgi:hypothetical protein
VPGKRVWQFQASSTRIAKSPRKVFFRSSSSNIVKRNIITNTSLTLVVVSVKLRIATEYLPAKYSCANVFDYSFPAKRDKSSTNDLETAVLRKRVPANLERTSICCNELVYTNEDASDMKKADFWNLASCYPKTYPQSVQALWRLPILVVLVIEHHDNVLCIQVCI